MRILKLVFSVIILISINSCARKQVYATKKYISFQTESDNFTHRAYNVPEKLKNDYDLNGSWEFPDTNGNIREKGIFERGVKVGEWNYFSVDKKNKINWKSYKTDSIQLSMPDEWSVIKQNGFYFVSILNDQSVYPQNKFFGIFENKVQDHDSLENFIKINRALSLKNPTISSYTFYEIETDNSKYYFSRYFKTENEEDILVLDMIGQVGDKIYEITYSSLKTDIGIKHIVFFDVVRNIHFRNEKFMPYLSERFTMSDMTSR